MKNELAACRDTRNIKTSCSGGPRAGVLVRLDFNLRDLSTATEQRLGTGSQPCRVTGPSASSTAAARAPPGARRHRKRDTHAPPRPPLRRLRDARREIQLPQMPRGVLLYSVLSNAQGDVRRPDSCDEAAAEAGRTGEARRPATGSRFRRGAIDAITNIADQQLRVGQRGVAKGADAAGLTGHDRGLDRP